MYYVVYRFMIIGLLMKFVGNMGVELSVWSGIVVSGGVLCCSVVSVFCVMFYVLRLVMMLVSIG